MPRARWIAFIVGTSVWGMAGVGCSDWFGNDLAKYTPPDAAKPDGGASDAPSEATSEGGGPEGGGTDSGGGADTGPDTAPAPDAGTDSSSQDASDGSIADAEADG